MAEVTGMSGYIQDSLEGTDLALRIFLCLHWFLSSSEALYATKLASEALYFKKGWAWTYSD